MENIGDFVYLLFLLVIFLFKPILNALKKKAKPSPAKSVDPQPIEETKSTETAKPSKGKTFEDIFNEILGEKRKEAGHPDEELPINQPPKEIKKEKPPKLLANNRKENSLISTKDPDEEYLSPLEEYQQRRAKQEKELVNIKKKKPSKVKKKEKESPIYQDNEDEFDLQQAIIHSIILKRYE